MTYLTIALPEAMKDYVDRQVSSGVYNTADEFLTAPIEQEQERQAKQKVNAMLRSTPHIHFFDAARQTFAVLARMRGMGQKYESEEDDIENIHK